MPLEVCVHLLLLRLWGTGPTHQNSVFRSGPRHSVVKWALGAKSLLFLVPQGGGDAQKVRDGWAGVTPQAGTRSPPLGPESCWGCGANVAGG